jgi:serine/threonine protein kinase
MEFITGTSLRKLLDSRWRADKPLSIKEVLKLGTSLCDAMEYAHQKTVHRDLKPDNILVTRDGKIKVSDFGIATLVSVSESRLTSGMLGTAYYMAPEQMVGGAQVDLRADIYSLGVILYEAIVGKIPVGRFKTPRELRGDVPEHVDRAILEALSPDIEQRPKSMAVLRQKLVETRVSSPPPEKKPVPAAAPATTKQTAPSSANKKRAQDLVAKGKDEVAAGRHGTAFEAFDDATKADAGLAEAWFERGRVMLAGLNAPPKDPTQGVMHKFKERGYVQADGAVTIAAITTALLKSYYEAALASFERATELEPENQIYKFNAAIQRGQIPNVLKTLGDTVKAGLQPELQDKNSVAYLVSTGNALLGAGKFEEAKEHYEKAIAKDRKCAAAYYGKSAAINGLFGKMDANQMANDIASGRTDLAKLQSMTAEMGVFAGKALALEPSNAIYRNWADQLRKINIHVP